MSVFDQGNRNPSRSRRGADPAGAFGSYPEDGLAPAAAPAPERGSALQRAASALTALRKKISLEDEPDAAEDDFYGSGWDEPQEPRGMPQEPLYYEAPAAAPAPPETAFWENGAPDAVDPFFSPNGWGEPAPDGWTDPYAGQEPYPPQEEPARPARSVRRKDRGDLAYTFWSAAIVTGILLTVFAFIYGCVA